MTLTVLFTWKAELVDGRRLAADGAPAACCRDGVGEDGEAAPKSSSCICLKTKQYPILDCVTVVYMGIFCGSTSGKIAPL